MFLKHHGSLYCWKTNHIPGPSAPVEFCRFLLDFSALSFINSSFFMSFPVPVTESIPKAWCCHHQPSLCQLWFFANAFLVLQPSELLEASWGHSSMALHVWKISQFQANSQLFRIFFTVLWQISPASPIFDLDWNFLRILSCSSAAFSLLEMLQKCSQMHVCLLWHYVKHFNNTEVRRLVITTPWRLTLILLQTKIKLFICWTGTISV